MGAEQFFQVESGKNAREAFNRAVEQACWEHGHGGYSGTLAEKHSFVEIRVPKEMDPALFANMVEAYWPGQAKSSWCPEGEPESCGGSYNQKLNQAFTELSDTDKNAVREAYQAVQDKWGPAGCVDLGDGRFAFLGWASS
jgi:hypothetical protein